jgi:hypothetical protein
MRAASCGDDDDVSSAQPPTEAGQEEARLRLELSAARAEIAGLRLQLAAARSELDRQRQAVDHDGQDELERKLGELQSVLPAVAPADGPYLVLACVGGSYELVEAAGAVPAPGERVEVLGRPQLVLRIGPSPLAGSTLPCVYTIPDASSPTDDSRVQALGKTPDHGNQSRFHR